VLAGDVGGTNTNLALIGKKGGDFTLLLDRHYKTQEELSLAEPLLRFLKDADREKPGLAPELCCLSGAGPVVDEKIELTNAPWGIAATGIASEFGFPTRVINDFTAVSYGVLLLDQNDPDEVTRIPRNDGRYPKPDQGPKLIVGAGTGLGVGYVVKIKDRIEAFPSEGGHITLPVYNEECRNFQRWLEFRYDFPPGAEAGVSGQGIANIFLFQAERESGPLSELAQSVIDLPEADRPARIAACARKDPLCARTMDMFVKLYARVAADLSATLLPSGGLFLAGGIASKNEAFFLEDDRFRSMFERSYREHIKAILARVPVMIVKDYSISLYGAANAAVVLA